MAPNKHRIKLKGRLKRYTQTSVYLGILLILINLVIYLLSIPAGCFLPALF